MKRKSLTTLAAAAAVAAAGTTIPINAAEQPSDTRATPITATHPAGTTVQYAEASTTETTTKKAPTRSKGHLRRLSQKFWLPPDAIEGTSLDQHWDPYDAISEACDGEEYHKEKSIEVARRRVLRKASTV